MFDLTHATWRPNRYGGSEKKRTLLSAMNLALALQE